MQSYHFVVIYNVYFEYKYIHNINIKSYKYTFCSVFCISGGDFSVNLSAGYIITPV